MANLDFNSIYREDKFDYIHSHAKNFNSFIEMKGENFDAILKDIKNNLVKVLKQDIENFRKIEDFIAEKQIEKFKNNNIPIPSEFNSHDRHGLKNYMTFLTKVLKGKGVTPLSSIVKFKTNMIVIKEQADSFLGTRKRLVNKIFPGKEFEDLTTKQQKEISDNAKIVQKRKELEKKVKELVEGLAQYLHSLIIFVLTIYDPHQGKAFVEDNTMIAAAKGLQQLFISLGITNLNSKTIIQDIERSIRNLGPETFLATFLDNSKAKDFFQGVGDKVNANANLGIIFEEALRDAFKNAVVEDLKGRVISVFDKGDVSGVGSTQFIRDNVTMDLQLIKQDTDLGRIRFGASLKLRGKDTINSSMEEAKWQEQFKSFLGEENFKTFSYFRKNTIALNTFKVDDKTELKSSLNQLIIFEREILDIISVFRLLIGFYKLVKKQYITSGSNAEEFYYTAYIFGLDEVISSSDALEALLNDVLKNNTTIIDEKETIRKFEKNPLELKNNQILSKKQLENFWENKQKAIKKIKKRNMSITYKGIMSDEDILQELLNLNEALGDFSYKGGIFMQTTTSNIKDSIANFNKNKS